MTKQGIQAKATDTILIENRLRNTKVGDLVTYDELSKLLGRDVRLFCKSNVDTARRTLISESVFFDCVTGEGYKRLDNEEAVSASNHYRTRARKAARRGMNHLAHVPFEGLTDESKKKHMAISAQLGAIDLFSSTKSLNKIEAAVDNTSHALAIGETLKLFGG